MKKYLIVFLFVLIISPDVIFAQTSLPDAGLLPDSSLYFLKSWKESIQLFFTFNAENKAKQYLHLAEIRLAEYQKMLEKGKADIAEKTLDKYENQLNHALIKAEEIKQKGKDIKDLSLQIEQATSKHLEVLQQNLEKVPETAKKGLETAIENSKKGIESVLEKKLENKEEKQNEIEEKQENQQISEDETKDWKTYIDTNIGWEIKLPDSYSIDYDLYSKEYQGNIKKQIEEKDGVIRGSFYLNNNSIIFVKYLNESFKSIHFGGDRPAISISISKIQEKPDNLTLFDYVNTVMTKPYYDAYFATDIVPVENVKGISFSKRQIIVGEPFVFEGCPNERYWIEKDKKYYIEINLGYCFTIEGGINFFAIKDDNLKSNIINEINQILSTFKFINQ